MAGVEGATLEELAEALGGTVESLNSGDYLRLVVDMDCIQSSKSRQFALSISHTSLGACPHP